MAVGQLEFEGKKVDLDSFKAVIGVYRPGGKGKKAAIKLVNYTPMMVAGSPGKPMMKAQHGLRNFPVRDVCQMPVKWDDKSNTWKYNAEETVEGTLHYFERKTPKPIGYTFIPGFLPFKSGWLNGPTGVDSQNNALLLYMHCHSRNIANKFRVEGNKEIGWCTTPTKAPIEIVMPVAGAKKNVVKLNDKQKAFNKIDAALSVNLELAEQLYGSYGMTDWTDHIVKGKLTDDGRLYVREFLMTKADEDPARVLEKLSDTALDISAKITKALVLDVLKQEGMTWYWGNAASDGKYKDLASAKKKIVAVPNGKGPNKEAIINWFCDWLKSEPNVMSEINTELDELRLREAA